MNLEDENFLNVLNEYYPFNCYVFKEPASIGLPFDDLLITEIYIPHYKAEPLFNNDKSFSRYAEIPYEEEVYVTLKGSAGETRIGYFDFASHVREDIRFAFIEDFGDYNYEGLYVEHENPEEINQVLEEVKQRIIEKHGQL